MGRRAKQRRSDAAAPQGANNNIEEKETFSPLWTALKHEDEEELLDVLFDKINDAETGEVRWVRKPNARKAVSQPNAKKMLPLSYAVSEGLGRALLNLLLRAGAAVNKKDETLEQSTALHAACWNEDGEAVELLLHAGADPRVVDADGRTPLHILATSNAANLMLQLLDSVSSNVEDNKNNDDSSDDGEQLAAATSPATLKMDPIELLGVPDKAQGATALHLALGDSTFNFGVAQSLCEYLEKMKSKHASAVAHLVSARTKQTGDSPLHALVAAANAEDEVVESLVRRLLILGADPFACNADGQSILEVAVNSRPGCSTNSAVKLYKTLLTPIIKSEGGSAFLTEKNKSGRALIHVAISAVNVAAVRALCSLVPAGDAKAVLGDVTTDDGILVVELLATTPSAAGAAEMTNALVAAQAVAKDAYSALRQRHEELQAELSKTAKEEEEQRRAEKDVEGVEGEVSENDEDVAGGASSAVLARLRRQGIAGGHNSSGGGGGTGISRVQQARRARAATVAQRKQHSTFGQGAVHNGKVGRGGLFGGGELSTTVKVVGVLLLLSIFLSAYTTFFGLYAPSPQGT